MESPQDAVEHSLGGIPMLNDEKKPFAIFGGRGGTKESVINYKHRYNFPQKMAAGY